jgi:hypothetical protein
MTYKFGDCSHPGCDGRNVRVVRGLCEPHYDRLRKYGNPSLGMPLKGSGLKFFNEVVLHHDSDECLIWPFARAGNGYGQITVGGKKVNVHRHTCAATHGEPPTRRHEAAHSCGNGHLGCVNPRHLSWKTASQNQMDRVAHGTSNRGERQHLAKLTTPQVLEIKHLLPTMSNAEIGAMFGVASGVIRHVRFGTSWAWLTPEQQREAA